MNDQFTLWLKRLFILYLSLSWLLLPATAYAQTLEPSLLAQDASDRPVRPLTSDEQAELNDPFFNLVLKEHSDETNLATLEALIQPNADQRETFIVDERIVSNQRGESRRAVLTFKGTHQGEFLSPNIMMSVRFDSEAFSDDQSLIEVWGWDDQRGRYNYYALDRNGTTNLGRPTWKFRGSSVDADLQTVAERQGTCLQCHTNGGPIMKELFLPWNNWDSDEDRATYLNPTQPNRWPVANTPRLSRRTSAELLESSIVSAIKQFNQRRLNAMVQSTRTPATVTNGTRLLKPLFETTEFNILSSTQTTRLHPFSRDTQQPETPYNIPDSFFLNADLIAGGSHPQKGASFTGLGIAEARTIETTVTAPEYEQLVQSSGVKLSGEAGDANFAWLYPEASFIDNDFVGQLMERNIVPRSFVAAVMAVDLETPILSGDRKSILDSGSIPTTFQITPTNTLIPDTIAALTAKNPDPGSPEGEFLTALQSNDPIAFLRDKVEAYIEREAQLLDSPSTRMSELQRLYQVAIDRRQAILDDPSLRSLDETNGRLLFPLP